MASLFREIITLHNVDCKHFLSKFSLFHCHKKRTNVTKEKTVKTLK